MQFCLHYGWDSEENARTMLSNAARWLRPGGTLIGTTVDDETLLARLHEDEHAVSFGNECYRIEFDQRIEPGEKPFGNRYHFWLLDAVDNVPEFVVDWAAFTRYVAATDAASRKSAGCISSIRRVLTRFSAMGMQIDRFASCSSACRLSIRTWPQQVS